MMYVRRVSIDEMGGRDETSDGREVFWRGGGVFLVVRESERGTGAGGGKGLIARATLVHTRLEGELPLLKATAMQAEVSF